MSSAETGLEFEKNTTGSETGLRNGQIEFFDNLPYEHCAREITQNSLDAKSSKNDQNIEISFNIVDVNCEEIPFITELRSVLKQCKEADTNDAGFFSEAITIAGDDKIKVLQIEDYGTTGLKGPPNKRKSPFQALIKGDGVSNKESHTAGGSYGIGKWAPFALSKLRTVIYSTIYENGEEGESFAAQGRCQLRSHENADGDEFTAKGFWGRQNYKAIEDIDQAPKWLKRSELGTSIFVLGVDDLEEWGNRIKLAVVTNFFKAIYDGEISFSIGNSQKINRENIKNILLHDKGIEKIAKDKDLDKELSFSRTLFSCLDKPDRISETFESKHFGSFKLSMILEAGLPKKVGFIRNGMFICKKLGKTFANPKLAQFSHVKEFVAVLSPEDDLAKSLMRKAENPAHNELEVSYAPTREEEKVVKTAFKKLSQQVSEFIKKHAELEISDKRDISELAEYFPNYGEDNSQSEQNLEPDPEIIVVSPKPKKKKQTVIVNNPEVEGEQPGSGRDYQGENPIGPNPPPRHKPGPRISGENSGNSNVLVLPVRSKFSDSSDHAKRVLFFTAPHAGRFLLTIYASGVEGADKLQVVESSSGEVRDGSIELSLSDQERKELTVKFESVYASSVLLSSRIIEAENLEGE